MSADSEVNQKLEKMQLPTDKVSLTLSVEGIFGFPEEWKQTDEANPGLFTYICRFMNSEFTVGKVQPRKQTERYLRELEEQAKKKAGKKEAKMDPAEEERIRKLKEQEAEEDRKKQAEFDALPYYYKKYALAEDPFKSPSIKFEKNSDSIKLTGKQLVIFYERVSFDQGYWIYIFKMPTANEYELAKLRKSKPKTLNLNDLNPVTMRAWLDFSKLTDPSFKDVTLRGQLKQIDETADTPKPNLYKTYIMVKLGLAEPLAHQTDPTSYLSTNDLIKPIPPPQATPLDVQAVNELREEIRLALESIAMEYSTTFWKELNFVYEQKNINSLAVPKKTDINRRKYQFLYDFNMTGKYRILKERLKKVIVQICKHKYASQLGHLNSFTGVSTEAKDQFYSYIYNFLVQTTQYTLDGIVVSKRYYLGMTTVPTAQIQTEAADRFIRERINEKISEKAARLAKYYEQLKDVDRAKYVFNRLLKYNPDDIQLKLEYSRFCLRNKIGSPFPQKILTIIYYCLRHDRYNPYLKYLYCFLLMSTKKKSYCRQAWVILNELLNSQPQNTKLLMICSFLFKNLLNEEDLGQKYLKLTERIKIRLNDSNLSGVGTHRTTPITSELPSIKSGCYYSLNLKDPEKDGLYLEVIREFAKINLYNLVELLLPELTNKDSEELQLISIKTEIFKGNSRLALETATELFNTKVKSFALVDLITQISFELKEFSICYEFLKKSLKFPEANGNAAIYIRLTAVYEEQGKYGNSQACLVKLLKDNKDHTIGWLKLGIVLMKMKQYAESLKALREANVLDPDNSDVWLQLAYVYIQLNKGSVANRCLLNYATLATKKKPQDLYYLANLKIKATANGESQDSMRVVQTLYSLIEADPLPV